MPPIARYSPPPFAMDEKAPLLPRAELPGHRPLPRAPRRRLLRLHTVAFLVIVGVFWLTRIWKYSGRSQGHNAEASGTKVPLEIHIMSKCPDAKRCLEKLVLPTMQNVSDKVDFRLSFIGTTTDEDDGVQCMHGQTECLGNILELCAASVYPDPKIYLGFTMCLTAQYEDIPKKELVQDCALEHGIDFDKINDCVSQDDGAYGMGMLRDSVLRSQEKNVTKSCTVRLDDKIRCIVDGGEYKNCSAGSEPKDLVNDIKKLYEAEE